MLLKPVMGIFGASVPRTMEDDPSDLSPVKVFSRRKLVQAEIRGYDYLFLHILSNLLLENQ
jgi:hypothetical protein